MSRSRKTIEKIMLLNSNSTLEYIAAGKAESAGMCAKTACSMARILYKDRCAYGNCQNKVAENLRYPGRDYCDECMEETGR